MKIYCCGCEREIKARITWGKEIYPFNKHMRGIPFWICDTCGNYVGCHHKTNDRTKPLGCIATPEIKNARSHIHKLLDPLWRDKLIGRGEIYKLISKEFGYQYHTANIKTLEQGRVVYRIILNIKNNLLNNQEKL